MTVELSIIIPAYGVAATLRETIESALRCGVDVEVIVVDDASVDGSSEIADRAAHEHAVQVLHRSTSGGPAQARNDGLAVAAAPYVLFLDGDDQIIQGSLPALLSAVREEGVVAAAGRFRAVDEHGADLDIGTWARFQLQPVLRRRGRLVADPAGLTGESLLTRLITPPPGAIVVRRDSARRVGGFDPRVGRSEDLDFLMRLLGTGKIALVDHEVLRYRRARGQRSAAIRGRQYGRQWTILRMIVLAPTRLDVAQRSRGARNHHLETARVRLRQRQVTLESVVAVSRSWALAAVMTLAGWSRIWRLH